MKQFKLNYSFTYQKQVMKHKNAKKLEPLIRFPISCLTPKSRTI